MSEIISFLLPILTIILIYMILALSLNLALGFAGLLSMGHIALFGIGAYTSALLTTSNIAFIPSFILAGILSGIFSFILIFATRKLKGDYFVLATLSFSFVIYSLLLNLTGLTSGPKGIAGIPRPSFFGVFLNNNLAFFLFVALITLLSFAFIYRLTKSNFGKLVEALRDDELRIRILGKDSSKLKYKVMFISGFFAGIAGSLFAHYISFIDPSTFYLDKLILILTIVIIGGIASLKGTVVAAFIIVLVPEFLRFFPIPDSVVGPLREISYGLILLIILLFKPRGIYGRIDIK